MELIGLSFLLRPLVAMMSGALHLALLLQCPNHGKLALGASIPSIQVPDPVSRINEAMAAEVSYYIPFSYG